jgi:hypothetical protein
MLTPVGYFDLLETLPKSGCAICNLALRDVRGLLDVTLYEFAIDPEIERKFRASRGLCNEHGWQLMQLGSALGIASLYQQVIDELLTITKHSVMPSPRKLAQRFFAPTPNASLAAALQPTQPCIACRRQHESEVLFTGVLSAHIAEARMQAAYRASEGLCLEHFRQTLLSILNAEDAKTFIALQREIWKRLQAELHEFMRKSDYHNVDEKMGTEGDSWQRAIARVGGEKGVFGLRRSEK